MHDAGGGLRARRADKTHNRVTVYSRIEGIKKEGKTMEQEEFIKGMKKLNEAIEDFLDMVGDEEKPAEEEVEVAEEEEV